MNDLRSSHRRDTVLYLRILRQDDGSDVGRLADLSEAGALVVSETPVPLKIPVEVRVELPSGLFGGDHSLTGTLIPRWQRPDRNPDLVLSGCMFNVAPGQEQLISKVMDRYSFSSGSTDFRRLFEERKREE